MADGAGDVETLLSALHQFGVNRDGNASAPVHGHLAGVVIIRADAETNRCVRELFTRGSTARRNLRRSLHLRLWNFVTNRNGTRNRNPWAAAISGKIERRLRPDFLRPHPIGKNVPCLAGAALSTKTSQRAADGAAGKHS